MERSFKKTWRIPFVLGLSILFGLLSALLGTGFWYGISWAAMIIPLLVVVWKIYVARRENGS
ncbi:MAG TPA: hypothetical protein VHD83_24665 [Puia sp.]|nr:hypothetical protein [Puia sp.]